MLVYFWKENKQSHSDKRKGFYIERYRYEWWMFSKKKYEWWTEALSRQPLHVA